MDPKMKKAIIDDLDLFLRRRDFYKKLGKAWKRGYLLYGPPGTGKSSLIAAISNYLKFDIYDLQLMNVGGDLSLKKLMLRISNRSILVIEDIDCSIQLPDRKGVTPSRFPEIKSVRDPQLAVNIYGCNMEREIWDDPEEWKPERFLAENKPIDLLTTMAFGGGKRVCAGAMQAMLLGCMAIGRMVHEFEWRLQDDTGEDANTIGMTTQKLNPILAVITPRN